MAHTRQPLEVWKCRSHRSAPARDKQYVAALQPIRLLPVAQFGSHRPGPLDAIVDVDIPHLDDKYATGIDYFYGPSERVAGPDIDSHPKPLNNYINCHDAMNCT